MNRAVVLGAGAALLAAVVATAIGWRSPEAAGIVLAPSDADVVARGKAVYDDACAACHGRDLEGQPDWRRPGPDGRLPAPPHDRTGHTWHHDGAMLFRVTKYGIGAAIGDPDYPSDMPAYADTLTDDDIVAVLSYIKSTWPPDIRARHDALEQR